MEESSTVAYAPNAATLKLPLYEAVIVGLLVVLVGYLGFHLAPGTKYWDDLLYIHTAWNMEKVPYILNRYFIIYSLGIFNLFSGGDPIVGAKYYGAFAGTMIVALVYLNARILAKKHQVFSGLVAILLLLSFVYFTEDFGTVMPDFSATVMILMGTLAFLCYWRFSNQRNTLLILFGLLLFLAIRTKETGIMLGFLAPGFFIDTGESLTKRVILKKLGLVFIGGILGVLVLIFLNGIFLKDWLFGWRLSELRTVMSFNTDQRVLEQEVLLNYFNYISASAAFVLALIWIVRSDDDFQRSNRWLWFSVLGIICFLHITTINAGIPIVPRYLTPAVAILSILGSQVIPLTSPSEIQVRTQYFYFMVAVCLVASGMISAILYVVIAKPEGWSFHYFAGGITYQIVLCLLIGWLCLKQRNSLLSLMVVVFCIGALTLPTVAHRIYKLASSRGTTSARLQPFDEFKNEISCTSGNVLISGTLHDEHGVLSRNTVSSQWMFNLFFRCHMNVDQFQYSVGRDEMLSSLLHGTQYAFLDKSDYDYLLAHSDQSQPVFDRYQVQFDQNQLYYLLTSIH